MKKKNKDKKFFKFKKQTNKKKVNRCNCLAEQNKWKRRYQRDKAISPTGIRNYRY